MKASLPKLVVFAAVFAVAACSAMMKLTISGGLERPVVRFDDGREACVDYLDVRDVAAPGRSLWTLRAVGVRCAMVGHIVYGETPRGFMVETPPTPLSADASYEILGMGLTTNLMSKVPWSGGLRIQYRDGRWREASVARGAPGT
ncbi:hypothetical protein [Brevundimonas sp.]|uniref:hypothetical protein n=1 Tax=Brevundimonas sp. TaxID=1871086 RepID=UPI0028A274E7|nr:hypothetical protein [Brevundimonas sp.]